VFNIFYTLDDKQNEHLCFLAPSRSRFGSIWIINDFVRFPSGQRIREATFKVLDAGPLHNFLESGASEPS